MMNNVLLVGDWGRALRTTRKYSQNFKMFVQAIVLKEAHLYRSLVVKTFNSQNDGKWLPLSKWTLAIRRFKNITSSDPLIETGEMRKSIVVKSHRANLAAFVGILYSARRSDGKRMVNIAKIHEYGVPPYAIHVTPKMRAFLYFVGREQGIIQASKGGNLKGGGDDIVIITIPARPFLSPAMSKYRASGVRARILQQLKMFNRL